MKKYITIPALIAFVSLTLNSMSINSTPGLYEEEVRISVVSAFEDCTVAPAVYQEFDEGFNKVMDLKPLERSNPYPATESNNRAVQDFLDLMGYEDYVIKMTEVEELEGCAKVTTYWLIRRNL